MAAKLKTRSSAPAAGGLCLSGLAALSSLCLPGCGSAAGDATSTAPALTYALEREATGRTSNALLLGYPEGTDYRFRLTGDGVTADVPMGEVLPLTPRIEFTYASEGDYEVDLELLQPGGAPYLADTLGWAYSTEVPEPPVVSFSEDATADAAVTMLIAGTRVADTSEILVEGDLASPHAAGGYWDTLPESNVYLLNVSEGDGLKTMTVRVRNIYGNASEEVRAEIIRKSTAPADCRAEMSGDGSASRTISLMLYATNDGPLFYNVTGDVDSPAGLLPFASGDTVRVKLSAGSGQKTLTVTIQDAAGNACDAISHTLTLSSDYVTTNLEISGNPYWTMDDAVDLALQYDHFPEEEPVEMRLSGDIMGDGVRAWVPYATAATVQLMPGAGEKKIYAQFRKSGDDGSFLVLARIYQNPSVSLTDAGAPLKNVLISRIRGMSHVTITGCVETYSQVAWQSAYTCEPNAVLVTARYTFPDGSTLALSAAP